MSRVCRRHTKQSCSPNQCSRDMASKRTRIQDRGFALNSGNEEAKLQEVKRNAGKVHGDGTTLFISVRYPFVDKFQTAKAGSTKEVG